MEPVKTWPFEFYNWINSTGQGPKKYLLTDITCISDVFKVTGWDNDVYYGITVKMSDFKEYTGYWCTEQLTREKRKMLINP